MEKAAVTGNRAGRRWEIPLVRCSAAALLACVATPVAWAQEAPRTPGEVLVAEARMERPLRMEVNTSTLPRMEAQDNGFQAPRVDVSLLPQGTSSVGAMFGLSTPRQGLQPYGLNAPRSSVDLGLRFSHQLQSQQRIDVMAWRRMSNDDDAYSLVQQHQPVYGARVEMKLTPVRKSGLALDRGFIGLQLESGARITIKRKDGRPMVYYRTTF